ncbi:hypothetical protein AB0A05_27275 [Streptomyces sp. NPDC046374]|uniref:hypothetical protein n=1 Tax=Streptomyces sp. NPDC046374 TaxID=3154917 RepID=UPI0033CD9A05
MTGQRLALADDREPWARQPGESKKQYGHFLAYMRMGRGGARNLTKAAENLTLSYGHVRNLASSNLWDARADAYWALKQREAEALWIEERRQALVDDAKILRAATGKIATELQRLPQLTPEQFMRLLDLTLRHRRVLYGDPTQIISVEAGGGEAGMDMASVLAETFAKMSPENRQAQLIDMGERLKRRREAAAGSGDEAG